MKRMTSLLREFRDFAVKGNVFDLAVGVIVGTEFGKIVNSLVKDVMMPIVSLGTGKVSVADWAYTVPSSITDGDPVRIQYGLFLQTIISFLIIAFCVFLAVKGMGTLRRLGASPTPESAPEMPAEPPPPSPEAALLLEIRDLLKNRPEPVGSDPRPAVPPHPGPPSKNPSGKRRAKKK